MTENYVQGRSASGRPLCFPLKSRKTPTSVASTIEEDDFNTQLPSTQMVPTQLHQPEWSPEDTPRFSTAIYQILERVENKIAAEEHQERHGFLDWSEAKEALQLKDQVSLWVDKYRPKRFTELLTMDSCNLEVLKWVKAWDTANVRFDKHNSTAKATKPSSTQVSQSQKNSSKAGMKADSLGRPEKKILLLHGAPGLGKTTLAHIAAQTAGYSVVEINASDERSGNSVQNKIAAAIEVKSAFTTDGRPNCIVIDEIDGAATAGNEQSLIKFLVRLAGSSHSIDDNDDESTEERKSSGASLIRPIICICNDLYVPALRPLRQVAHIVQVKPIGPATLSNRLRGICQVEGLKINTRSLVQLAESMDSDIRSALNALQFLQAKQATLAATDVFSKDLSFAAFKDSIKSPLKLYDSIFLKSNHSNQTTSHQRPYSQLIVDAWCSGVEVDRLMTGCFELFPDAKFFDNSTLDRVNASLEVFSQFDLLSNPRHLQPGVSAEGELDGYCLYSLARIRELFASPVPNPSIQYKYPRQDYENYLSVQTKMNIFKDYLTHLPAGIRSIWSREALWLERLPSILSTFFATLQLVKSTNPQLMRPEDKKRLQRIVLLNTAEGLHLRQVKIVDSATYKYVLDPPIDGLIKGITASATSSTTSAFSDPNTPQDSHAYALCRLIGTEMETERIRTHRPSATNKEPEPSKKRQASKSPSSSSSIESQSKKIARDFFGRPIVVAEEVTRTVDEEFLPIATEVAPLKIWYSQNDGVSNAVRRFIKISSFFE